MDPTSAPVRPWTETPPPLPGHVTQMVPKGTESEDGYIALIGGVVSAALLLLVCIIAVMLWCLSRHKGSYVTNETDDDEMDDDESVGSDTALQSREPLKTKEEE